MPKGKELTVRQKFFVEEYLVDKNATRAYIRAYSRDGYTPTEKTAGREGFRLLENPKIQRKIQEKVKKHLKELEITQKGVLQELAHIAFADIRTIFDKKGALINPQDLPVEAGRVISGVKIREEFGGRGNDREILGYTKQITLNNKIKALEMLAKHLNLFEEIGDDDRPFTVKVIYEEAQKGKAV